MMTQMIHSVAETLNEQEIDERDEAAIKAAQELRAALLLLMCGQVLTWEAAPLCDEGFDPNLCDGCCTLCDRGCNHMLLLMFGQNACAGNDAEGNFACAAALTAVLTDSLAMTREMVSVGLCVLQQMIASQVASGLVDFSSTDGTRETPRQVNAPLHGGNPLSVTPCPVIYHPMPHYMSPHAPLSTTYAPLSITYAPLSITPTSPTDQLGHLEPARSGGRTGDEERQRRREGLHAGGSRACLTPRLRAIHSLG